MAPQAFDGHRLSPRTYAFLARPHRLLINGVWVDGVAGATIDSFDPATGLKLATVAAGDGKDIDRAVAAARAAFDGPWSRVTARGRAGFMTHLARLIDTHTEVFTELEIIDNGMPRFIAALTVGNVVEMLDYYAGWATKIEGTTTTPPAHVTANAEALTYTLREPVGVAGLIIPWNVPLSTAILKLAPALAAGCSVVLKPSEETPLAAALLGELLLEAGLPAGVVNIVHGLGETAGAALAAHPDVDKISFTGSTEVGRKVIIAAAGNLKKVALELGGKSPVVVMPDADLQRAVPGVAMATFFLQGQNCMAGTRIFVHETIHDELVEGLSRYSKAMVLGHGLDPKTQLGPLISAEHAARVGRCIQRAVEEGARLVAGGAALGRAGHFLQPPFLPTLGRTWPSFERRYSAPSWPYAASLPGTSTPSRAWQTIRITGCQAACGPRTFPPRTAWSAASVRDMSPSIVMARWAPTFPSAVTSNPDGGANSGARDWTRICRPKRSRRSCKR